MMSVKTMASAVVLALVAAPAPAQEPPDCRERFAKEWQQRRETLLALKPDQPGYRPFPYPTTDAQIRANIRFDYMRMRGGEHGHPPKLVRERQLYDLIRADTFDIEVERVENWTGGRCVPDGEASYDHLVRILHPTSHDEVARMQVTQEGALGSWDFSWGLPADVVAKWKSQVPRLSEVTEVVARRFGVVAHQPRLIFADIEGGRCGHLTPCVLLVGDRGRRYVHVPPHPSVESGELFWFDERSPRISYAVALERGPLASPPQRGPYPGQFTMSLGSGEHVVLTAVPVRTAE